MQVEQTDPRPRMRPWLRVLLVLSLAFNLVIIGAAAGLALRFGRAAPPPFLVEGPGSPMVMALSHEHRRAVGRSIRRAYHEAEDGRRARAASYRDLAGVLEAEPLDLAALRAATRHIDERKDRHREIAREVWLGQVAGMSVAERRAYAARMREILNRDAPARRQAD